VRKGFPFSIYISEDRLKALDEIHWRERKSVSRVINRAIDEFIKAHAEGNDTFKLDNWSENPDFRAVPTILSHSTKWFSYLENCSKDELTNIAISARHILRQVEHFRRK
jgi:hypothetical protein